MKSAKDIFAASMKQLRMRRHVSQLEIAESVGISKSRISQIELGSGAGVRIDEADAIARRLGVKLVSMLDGTYATCEHTKLERQQSGAYKCAMCGDVVVAAPPPPALFGAPREG